MLRSVIGVKDLLRLYLMPLVLTRNSLASLSQMKWHFDETYIKINGKDYYVWFALDFETRVILDFHISEYRDSTAAHILLNSCNEQFGNLEMLWLWIATMLIESRLKDSFLTLILSKWKALTTLLTIIPSKPLTVSLRLGTNPKEGLSLLILQIF